MSAIVNFFNPFFPPPPRKIVVNETATTKLHRVIQYFQHAAGADAFLAIAQFVTAFINRISQVGASGHLSVLTSKGGRMFFFFFSYVF